MVLPRRFLPATSLLCAFEAASRHESFTVAAKELNLTQSAVSRQIRSLEEILGSELFERERQTVRLTLAGQTYAREISEVLRRLAGATLTFRANPSGGSLNLAVLPTFAARWLTPRLQRFLDAHPGTTVNLLTRLDPFDFNYDVVDAAIHFGMPDWPGAELDPLMRETVIPVCSAAVKAQFQFSEPIDILQAPLLHMVSRPDAWERWLREMKVPFDEVHGMLTDQFALSVHAASSGLGVALLPEFLIESELTSGDLVVAIDRPIETPEQYYLAWPKERRRQFPLTEFRDWLIAEAAAESL